MVQFAPGGAVARRRTFEPAQATPAREGTKAKRPAWGGAETGTEPLALVAAGTRDATLAQLLAFLAARIPPARQPPHLKQLGGHHKV